MRPSAKFNELMDKLKKYIEQRVKLIVESLKSENRKEENRLHILNFFCVNAKDPKCHGMAKLKEF